MAEWQAAQVGPEGAVTLEESWVQPHLDSWTAPGHEQPSWTAVEANKFSVRCGDNYKKTGAKQVCLLLSGCLPASRPLSVCHPCLLSVGLFPALSPFLSFYLTLCPSPSVNSVTTRCVISPLPLSHYSAPLHSRVDCVLGVLFSVLREVHGRYVKYFWIAKGITFDIDDEFV